jgi:predicted ATPase with chaperone activity
MTGPPGAGKSLLAACLPGILPELTPSEALEVSMIASVAGTLSGGRLIRTRPYRAPHHSASMVALVGGGLKVRPGRSASPSRHPVLDELPNSSAAHSIRCASRSRPAPSALPAPTPMSPFRRAYSSLRQ